ncbi:MAG: hypothetical protein BRD55_04570 [Bacteroidetes bacterium SW_9_63_38]|nr:MAG: hypothetical protein BRD55_04570 [Bacteroidetes bacterium SW_9_63_38]
MPSQQAVLSALCWRSGGIVFDYLTGPQAAIFASGRREIRPGLVLGWLLGNGLARTLGGDDVQRTMILRRVSCYGVTGLFEPSALMELGFDSGC